MQTPKYLPHYIIALFLITLFLRVVLVNYYDYNLGGIEPNVIYGIQRILLGQPLYQDPASGTYSIMQYTPLWYYLAAGVARLLPGQLRHGLDVHGIYVLCRVLALLFNLLTICVCAAIIRNWRLSWLHSLVFSLPVLMILTAHYYTRGDSMHLFLFITAIWLFICYSKEHKLQFLLLAALSTAACIMVKQSGVLVVGLIVAGIHFFERRTIHAVLYLSLSAISAGAIAWYCCNGDWQAFYQNTVLGLKNGVNISFLWKMFIGQNFLDMVPCYLLYCLILFRLQNREAKRAYFYLTFSAGISWLFAVFTGIKVGSSNNYFTEFLLLLLVAMPYVLQTGKDKKLFTVATKEVTIQRFALIAFYILITSKTVGFFTAVYIEKSFKNYGQEYANEQNLYQYFKKNLHIHAGMHIFFTERYFLDNIFAEYSIMPTKDVVTQVYIADRKTFDYGDFTTGMDTGKINYIVTSGKRDDINICSDSLPFIFFDRDHYKLIAHLSGYCIYSWCP